MEVASGLPSGGWPRPSFRWQLWQARALNSGPSPSEACVDDGADTQSLVKKPLPTLKVPSSSKVRLAEDCEKESRLTCLREVPAPPCISSNCSGLEKSVVCRVMAVTRARSFWLRSPREVARPAGSPSPALAVVAMSAATRPASRPPAICMKEGVRRAGLHARRLLEWLVRFVSRGGV